MTKKKTRGLAQRLKARMGTELKLKLTAIWRRLMIRTTVIAITGSMGKTTTKELLSMALATQGKTLKTNFNQNGEEGVARTLRSIRPWHRYAVIEIGTDQPGTMRRRAQLVRPDIAIMLCVAGTHQNNFGNLENTAKEKSELLRSLPSNGIAILNRDDERVLAMAELCPGKVYYYGTDPKADFVAGSANSGWPARLAFNFKSATEQVEVQTQLVGAHWLNSTAAALAAAAVCGVPLPTAAQVVADVKSFAARMQPIRVPNDAVFIRDEVHASVSAFEAMFAELIAAKAPRKGLVIGGQTDSKKTPRQRFRALGKRAAEHCDFVVFVGDHSHHGHNAAVSAGMKPAMCPATFSVEHAAQWLKENLLANDLVFVKGRTTEHLTRAVLAQVGDIGCWKTHCNRRHSCDSCVELKPQFDLTAILPSANTHPNLIAGN